MFDKGNIQNSNRDKKDYSYIELDEIETSGENQNPVTILTTSFSGYDFVFI